MVAELWQSQDTCRDYLLLLKREHFYAKKAITNFTVCKLVFSILATLRVRGKQDAIWPKLHIAFAGDEMGPSAPLPYFRDANLSG